MVPCCEFLGDFKLQTAQARKQLFLHSKDKKDNSSYPSRVSCLPLLEVQEPQSKRILCLHGGLTVSLRICALTCGVLVPATATRSTVLSIRLSSSLTDVILFWPHFHFGLLYCAPFGAPFGPTSGTPPFAALSRSRFLRSPSIRLRFRRCHSSTQGQANLFLLLGTSF